MPTATPAERRMVAVYRTAGSWKCAAAVLGMSEGNLRAKASRAFRRHGVRNITELTTRLDAEHVPAA
jgi:DNA-binding NarL/FixJ family response regulator